MIRVLCVEDDLTVQTYLIRRLEAEPEMCVVGAIHDVNGALTYIRKKSVDVLLLDYELPGVDGMYLMYLLEEASHWPEAGRSKGKRPAVLFCTGFADESFAIRADCMGARGVVAKERMARDLVPAIHSVAAGGRWFGTEGGCPDGHGAALTPRTQWAAQEGC